MNPIINILHIEDNPADAEVVQSNLKEAGLVCRITRVQTYDEIDAALRHDVPDLILADYRLPGCDGMSALKLARELCPEVPFIFVSGTKGEEAAIEGLTHGATDYVLKHNMVRFESAVKRALQEAQNRHERRRAEAKNSLRHAVEDRTSYDEIKRTVWPDGSIHWTNSRGKVYCDANGQPIRMIGVTFDITKWKEAEEEHQSHLWFIESLDRVNQAIQGADDLEEIMKDLLDVVISIFDCDRAFLLYPCDPKSPTWTSPMERNKPEYPGVWELNLKIPMDSQVAETLRILLAADGPVTFGPGMSYALPEDVSKQFDIKCFMSMAIYPKTGSPWQFGIHQCTYTRDWTTEGDEVIRSDRQAFSRQLEPPSELSRFAQE